MEYFCCHSQVEKRLVLLFLNALWPISTTVCALIYLAICSPLTISVAAAEERGPSSQNAEFGRYELQQSASDSVDGFLRRVPGFQQFRRSQSEVSHPSVQGSSLRGTSPTATNRMQVTLDGLPLNDSFGSWVNWNRVNLQDLELAGVRRGAGSPLFGLALDGIVELRSNRELGHTIDLQQGNRDFTSASLRLSEKIGEANFRFQSSYQRFEGYQTIEADKRGLIDRPAGSQHLNLFAELAKERNSDSELFFNFRSFIEDRDNGTALSKNNTRSLVASAGVRSNDPSSNKNLIVYAKQQTFQSSFSTQASDRNSETPALDQRDVPSVEVGIRGIAELVNNSSNLLSLAVESSWKWGETNEDFRYLDGMFTRTRTAGGSQRQTATTIENKLTPWQNVQIITGLRADLWENYNGERFERSLETSENTLREGFSKRSELLISPYLSASYDRFLWLQPFVSVYRTNRPPTLNELYRPFRVRNDITEANPSLSSEHLNGLDIGVESEFANLAISLTAFWIEVEDSILNTTIAEPGETGALVDPCGFVPSGGVCRQRQNIDRLTSRGLETSAQAQISDQWSVLVSASLIDSSIQDAPTSTGIVGKRTAQLPRFSATAILRYENPSLLSAAIELYHSQKRYEDDLNTLELGEFSLINFSVSRALTSKIELYGKIENLLDRRFSVGKTSDGLSTLGQPLLFRLGLRAVF